MTGSSAVKLNYRYVSFGSHPAFHSVMHCMLEEVGKLGIAGEGPCLSGSAIHSVIHSTLKEGGKLRFA